MIDYTAIAATEYDDLVEAYDDAVEFHLPTLAAALASELGKREAEAAFEAYESSSLSRMESMACPY